MIKINSKKVALIVLDGWGYREEKEHNAIAEARTPFFDKLWREYPHALLEASGLAVGLPEGQMGNSEVGHTTIGAGTVVFTDLVRIGEAAKRGEFDKNDTLQKLFAHANKNNSTLHLMGLIGPGGVHSHSDHLFEILRSAKRAGVKKVAIHAFTDGRDTPPQSAGEYLADLEKVIAETGVGFISTMCGRYFAMDRDNNWDRLAKAEAAMWQGEGMSYTGNRSDKQASTMAKMLYEQGKTDEHFEPVVFLDKEGKKELIKEKDAIFFFNFRADRARMLSEKIIKFAIANFGLFGTMTQYDKGFDCLVAFPPTSIETTLAKEISQAGLTQVHVAETEKFAHATYFLNGGEEKPYAGEKHILVPSRKDVATHDLAPEMMAEEIANKAIEEIKAGTDFVFVNFANADMVGHTANKEAIIKGLEKVDAELQRLVEVIEKNNGVAFITADHGNAEINFDQEAGKKHTAHTINPVPFICTNKKVKVKGGILADIAPTILEFLGLKTPRVMSGQSLLD